MAIFRGVIEKYWSPGGEYWTNVYHLDNASIAEAMDQLLLIKDAERAVLGDQSIITKIRVDDMVPLTDNYVTLAINQAGQEPWTGQDPLPLFNVVRVDFNVAGGGRPSRKYLRGYLVEGHTSAMKLGAANLTLFNNYAAAVVATTACDVDGQSFLSGVASPNIAMRQLRRGSKKKVTP